MTKEKIVYYYEEGEWSIELRTRNNHPGYKVWVLHNNYEISSIDESGLRNRCASTSIIIPHNILELALSAWEDCQISSGKDENVATPYSVSL